MLQFSVSSFFTWYQTHKNIFWGLVGLTLVGAVLRLYAIQNTFLFLGDQGRDALIVRELLVHFDPILVGPTTSVGKIQLGPLYYYFMAPWLVLSNFHPVGPAIGVALLSIASIPLMFYVVRQMFSQTVAAISTVLFTFSSIAIEFARFSWNPNPMPFVVLVLLLVSFRMYKRSAFHLFWVQALVYAVALQLHYMVLLLVPFLGIMWLILAKKAFQDQRQKMLFIRHSLVAVLVFALCMSPLVIFDLRHDFINYQGFAEFFTKGHHSPQNWYRPILNVEGRWYQSVGELLGLSVDVWLRNVSTWLIVLLFLLRAYQQRTNAAYQLLGMYMLSSVVGLALYSGDVFPHYILYHLPVSILMLAIVLAWLYAQAGKLGKIVCTVGIICFVGINLSQYPALVVTGLGYATMKQTSQVIAADAAGSTYNILAWDDTKDYRAMNYRYILEILGTPAQPLTNYSQVETVYIISQWQIDSLAHVETRELEAFLGKRVSQLTGQQEQEAIKLLTRVHNGPYVYTLTY